MIDPDLLRQLGWDENLIAEVNRVAQSITTHSKTPPGVQSYEFVAPTQGGTSFHFNLPLGASGRQAS
jgi:hypothetical protein